MSIVLKTGDRLTLSLAGLQGTFLSPVFRRVAQEKAIEDNRQPESYH